MLPKITFLLATAAFLRFAADRLGTADAYNVVRVCSNKHCSKRARGDVLQTIHNLLGTTGGETETRVVVEASGCLSHCDKGPNLEVKTKDGTTILQGMIDAQMCAYQLGEISSASPSFPPVPKLLVAASKVIEQSERFASEGNHREQIRYLGSVIDKVGASPSLSPLTAANAHAHALRARAHLKLACSEGEGLPPRSESFAASVRDARRVVQDFSEVSTPSSLSIAYRTWADALLEQQKETEDEPSKQRDLGQVVAVLTQWHRVQPVYRTKLQGEIRGLLANT